MVLPWRSGTGKLTIDMLISQFWALANDGRTKWGHGARTGPKSKEIKTQLMDVCFLKDLQAQTLNDIISNYVFSQIPEFAITRPLREPRPPLQPQTYTENSPRTGFKKKR